VRVAIAYPPLPDPRGVPLLTQNRQFQWFSRPTYIFPVVPAAAAAMLKEDGNQVLFLDGIAANLSPQRFDAELAAFKPHGLNHGKSYGMFRAKRGKHFGPAFPPVTETVIIPHHKVPRAKAAQQTVFEKITRMHGAHSFVEIADCGRAKAHRFKKRKLFFKRRQFKHLPVGLHHLHGHLAECVRAGYKAALLRDADRCVDQLPMSDVHPIKKAQTDHGFRIERFAPVQPDLPERIARVRKIHLSARRRLAGARRVLFFLIDGIQHCIYHTILTDFMSR